MIPQDIEKLKAEFGDREFTGKQAAEALGLNAKQYSGALVNQLKSMRVVYQTPNGWRFGTMPVVSAPASIPTTPVDAVPCAMPMVARIGRLYLHERLLLLAYQEQPETLRIYTTIIEVDPATKHPRNKIINIRKAYKPREYAQVLAWLDGMAGTPPAVVDDTALELAAELERKLNAALDERDELKRKLDAIRGAL